MPTEKPGKEGQVGRAHYLTQGHTVFTCPLSATTVFPTVLTRTEF